ncbi:Hypothetical Protein FCC1311_064732 [Hondaea fermentalgiana]|uniref:GxGYxYP putative glycoside hydrolase C-terminal domain-containing protein n=1 Tax=Hondaea fermentalgiana TaxID=2315210 RepID=A0A2R5GNQ4_9STRA|nr:Hypothetical Protein FCC1311_064732 [Hondaea fermentalgiana]|eukprot:GBG30253.1 Hypothetical Protein FCC1311_064732 [Hondaea fermentalgiana]
MRASVVVVVRAERAYVIMTEDDAFWWVVIHASTQEIGEPRTTPTQRVDAETFVRDAVQRFGVVLYAAAEAKNTLATAVTLAGVLSAVPLEQLPGDLAQSNITVKVDTRAWSKERALFEAEAIVGQTTSLAVQKSTLLLRGELVDFIVKERIFVTDLAFECVPLTYEHAYLHRVVDKAPWRRPIRVYGYNTQVKILGGYTFEAETGCLASLGQIASQQTHNLAFWNERPGISEPLRQKQSDMVRYDPELVYVAIVYGDMDNLDFVQGFAREHMRTREARCAAARETCFPLTWTLSPNLLRLAPDLLRWYMSAGERSGNDWFIFPPSGTLYAYPGMFSAADQHVFVQQMTADARLMNTSGSVHWEWFYRWKPAFETYFTQYTHLSHSIRSFFLNDVPWPIPLPDMALRGETYRVLSSNDYSSRVHGQTPVVLFKPAFNWAPGNPSGGLSLPPALCAQLLGRLSRGSIQYMYTIQTTAIEDIFTLAAQLPEHVRLVSYEQLAHLALQREANRERGRTES